MPAAEQRFEGPADRLHVDAHARGLLAVDLHRKLRLVEAQVRVRVCDRLRCARLVEQRIGHAFQVFVGVRLHHVLHRRIAETLAERRRIDREREHAGQAAEELRRELGRHVLRLALALLPRVELAERDAQVDGVRAVQARRNRGEVGLDLRNLGVHRLDLPQVAVGVVHRRPFGRQQQRDEETAVFARRQFGLERLEQQDGSARDQREDADHDPARVERDAERAAVSAGHGLEETLHRHIEPAVRLVPLEDLCAHHRRERERDKT